MYISKKIKFEYKYHNENENENSQNKESTYTVHEVFFFLCYYFSHFSLHDFQSQSSWTYAVSLFLSATEKINLQILLKTSSLNHKSPKYMFFNFFYK